MDDSPEVIRQQMEETRTSLTEKLEQLEHQVAETVHDARSAVAETVGTVKEAVKETVETVKDTFDLRLQFQRHPWVMFGASIAVGYIGERLLEKLEAPNGHAHEMPPLESTGMAAERARIESDGQAREQPAERAGSESPGFLASLSEQFEPELHQLKSMAIGAALGLMRDTIAGFVPEPMRPQLSQLFDSVTIKLDGQPVAGPLNIGDSHEERNKAEMGRSMGPTQGPSQGAVGQSDGRRFQASRGQL